MWVAIDIAPTSLAYLQLLLLRGYAFNASADFETIRMMKEQLCYSAYDVEAEDKLATDTTVLVENYKLPDGRVIKVRRLCHTLS